MTASLLARKSSDSSSSSEVTAAAADDRGCGRCIINFLHLRSHTSDAVVDGNTKKEDSDMNDPDRNMIHHADDDMNREDACSNTMKSPPACQDEIHPRYPSPSPDDVESKMSSATTPPALPRKRSDSFDILTNEPSSAGSVSAELQSSATLSIQIPALLQFQPESLQPPHLIGAGNENDAPVLRLNSVNDAANPNEAREDLNMVIHHIPRINLRMRQSNTQTTSHHRIAEGDRNRPTASNRLPATHPTMETRQTGDNSGFVPIQNSREGDDNDEDL